MLGGGQVNSRFRVSNVFSYGSSSGGKMNSCVWLRGGNLGNRKERVVRDVRSQLTVYCILHSIVIWLCWLSPYSGEYGSDSCP